MWLIGQEWKYSNVCSGLILIGRGLDLKQMVLGKLGKKASVRSSLFSFEGADANSIVGVICDEGTPVPIPNTVVKLTRADNTRRAASREDKSTPTQITAH